MPDQIVVIPVTCDGCQAPFEVHCTHAVGFGVMRFYAFGCPVCEQPHEKLLPGDIVRVVRGDDIGTIEL